MVLQNLPPNFYELSFKNLEKAPFFFIEVHDGRIERFLIPCKNQNISIFGRTIVIRERNGGKEVLSGIVVHF